MKMYVASHDHAPKKTHKDGTVNLYFGLPRKLHETLKRTARKQKISMRQFVRDAIQEKFVA